MSYFYGVKSIAELKCAYRRLAALHHPDRGGDARQMQEINAYYEHVRAKLLKVQRHHDSQRAAPQRPSYDKAIDFSAVKVGDTVYVNGTEGEVTEVNRDSFLVVAKGRTRQAVFNKAGGKGKFNQRLHASYDNRHQRPVAATA